MKRFRKGDLGWDSGCAVCVLCSAKSRLGYVYVVAVTYMKNHRRGAVWLEASTHKDLKKILGPDCNGDLPKKSWFKKYL